MALSINTHKATQNHWLTRGVFYSLRLLFIFWFVSLFAAKTYADISAIYYDQNGTQGAYFTGTQVQQVDANINFNWGSGAPTAGIGSNDFTVRWMGEFEVPTSGDYTFTTNSDDGVRLSINGVQVIENWTNHAPTEDSAVVTGLVAGQRYPILMELYERGGGAVGMLYWTGPGIAKQIIPSGNLFIDSTAPTVSTVSAPCLSGEATIYFSEPVSSASATNIANYAADSGVVLTNVSIDSTNSIVTLNYFAGSGDNFNLTVSNISDILGNTMATPSVHNVTDIANGLLGTYFDQNNTARQYFTGNELQRVDATVDFTWGTGSPDASIGNNDFTVRWVGEVEIPTTGTYLFYTVSDDGVRLDFDGSNVINNWTDHGSTTNTSAPQILTAGERYPITMEFYERGGQATARLLWSGPGIAQQAIPFNQLYASCPEASASLVAEWDLDESTWSGVANEVLDSSSNTIHGQAVNLDELPSKSASNPAKSGDPGTCAYGIFDGTSDGYLEIVDPGISSAIDFDNEYSVAAWVYPKSFPSSGLTTLISKNQNYEIHLDTSGQIYWWWGGAGQELSSASPLTINAWNHIAVTYKSGEQVIYINGASSSTHTSNAALSTNNDNLLIGSDIGNPNQRIDALIDEVQLYNAALTSVQVSSIMDETHTCPISPVDHYAISHSGSSVTCESENVTITAHDASELSTNVAGDTIRITATSLTPGWQASDTTWQLQTGTGSLINPSDGVAEYTFGSGEDSFVVAFSNASEAQIDFDIVDTSNASLGEVDGGSEDPALNFKNTAFRFYNDANSDGNADDTSSIASPQIAGQSSAQIILRAVETDTETGECIARVQGTQTVELAYECVDPSSCIRDKDLTISASAIEENNLNNVVSYSGQNLTFDAEGETSFTYNYADVGNIRLHARLNLASTGSEAEYTMSGSSATVTVKPHDLFISSITSSSNVTNPSTTTTGNGFVAAGEAFQVTVEARNANGTISPNFGRETIAENITLNSNSLVLPVGGNLAGLNAATSFTSTGTQGEFINTSVNWPEVGTITINASIADADYLGAGDVTGSTSTNVGRFYPASYNLISHSLTAGCSAGAYTYMSDLALSNSSIDFMYTVRAESALNGTTQNYDASLGYPVDSFVGVAEDGNNGVELSSRISAPSGVWAAGEMVVNGSDNAAFTRNLSGANIVPDGPYTTLQFGLKTSGSGVDDITFNGTSLNMKADASNDCVSDGDCDAAMIGTTTNVRFGRLFAQNAHGPETAELPVKLLMQYWNGTAFEDNTDDQCTTISASEISFDSADIDTDANRTVSVGAGTSTGSFLVFAPGTSIGFTSGDANFSFSAPGAGNTGSFVIDFDLTNYPWLRSDWNQDGNFDNDTSLPGIEINFGSYRGHDRVIRWQEVLTD